MSDLKYDMTIEIMAMNQPTGSDDVLKAAVTGDTAWETDETHFVEPICIMLGVTEMTTNYNIMRITKATFETHGTYSLLTLNCRTDDANNVATVISGGVLGAIRFQEEKNRTTGKPVRDDIDLDAEEYLYDYGDKFCKLFKCAAKVTAVWTPDGTWTCSWYSPDGNLNRDVKGLKGEPSQSLEDFVKEWSNAR